MMKMADQNNMVKGIPSLSKEARNLKLGKYEHYKGDVVEAIGVSLHSETLEEFVTYKHVTGRRTGEPYFWARPIKMFLESIEKNGYKGQRFKYIGK